jgi:hypothetical protein
MSSQFMRRFSSLLDRALIDIHLIGVQYSISHPASTVFVTYKSHSIPISINRKCSSHTYSPNA